MLLTNHEMKEIESKVNSKLGELFKTSRILREEVLYLLEKEATLLKYPIMDDEICAFVCKKHGEIFVYINTNIPYEKQLFAAGHELYHIWYDRDVLDNSEMVNEQTLEDNTNDRRELKANYFAALLLVPTTVLLNELRYRDIKNNEVTLEQITKLMDLFYVPYKTIVRRLHEVEYISSAQLDRFLSIPDRDETDGVLLSRKKLQLKEQTQLRTSEIKFENLVENAISCYENGLISETKLVYLLSLVNKSPKDFNIAIPSKLPSEEEINRLIEDYDDEE